MPHLYNLYNLEVDFKKYLLAGNQKPVSVKNYLSDFRHFAGWLTSHRQLNQSSQSQSVKSVTTDSTGSTDLTDLTEQVIQDYKNYLASNELPVTTINRRLSSLRKFCSFCISQGWLTENVAKQVGNVGIVDQFQRDPASKNIDLEHINEFFTIINS